MLLVVGWANQAIIKIFDWITLVKKVEGCRSLGAHNC